MFTFSDDELIDILKHPDEWGRFDFLLSQKILKEKGKAIEPILLEAFRKQRNEELAKPDPGTSIWIPIGFVFAMLGGFLGLFLGWYIYKGKKTLPDGKSIYLFNETERKYGQAIFVASCIIFPIMCSYRIWVLTQKF